LSNEARFCSSQLIVNNLQSTCWQAADDCCVTIEGLLWLAYRRTWATKEYAVQREFPDIREEILDVTASAHSAAALKPLLEDCGYSGARLAPHFKVDDAVYPLVGFASKPWDFDSACIAVVETSGEPETAVRKCRQLGAPVVWVQHNGTVDWWVQHSTTPSRFDSRPLNKFASLVRSRRADLTPKSVYSAKVLGRLPGARQLDFVDVGLMPLLRTEAGEKLGKLVEEMTRTTLEELGQSNPSKAMLRDVFSYVFRLLAGKILKDKDVDDFGRIDLHDPVTVLSAVAKHYNAASANVRLSREWKAALDPACQLISEYGNVRVVSPESLAYVYEHTLVNKELRKKLGIHATPPYLVDYIVWQLYDWVREIAPADRHVFEPACGHAPFLLAAMRMLRLEMQGQADHRTHTYLKTHMHGVDVDNFALEIARLSLTLADIPNPNGWNLNQADMYASNVLTEEATRCRIMLANPPYERFTQKDRAAYARAGMKLAAHTKACEMLYRTIPHMAEDACFGVVVPQGLLHSREAMELRRTILSRFELSEIDVFGDKLFEKSDHEVAVLIGRRKKGGGQSGKVWFRRVRNADIHAFRDRFAFSSQEQIETSRFMAAKSFDLRLPELNLLWEHLSELPTLGEIAALGQGLFHKGRDLPPDSWTVREPTGSDDVLGYSNISEDLAICGLPREVAINLSPSVVDRAVAGFPTDRPQVLLNYARVSREAWKLKAILDEKGHAITSRFIAVRPTTPEVSTLYLWAILNSPVANAYTSCHLGKRDVLVGTMRKMPVPRWSSAHAAHIEQAAMRYCKLATSPGQLFDTTATPEGIKQALLEMDAAVLHAYGLPARLERQLLDFFRGAERKGVGCPFDGYFPLNFKSIVPLHKYISSGYRKSTVDQVAERMRPGESSHVLAGLRSAAQAFGEES
jgi:hypothetical protein